MNAQKSQLADVSFILFWDRRGGLSYLVVQQRASPFRFHYFGLKKCERCFLLLPLEGAISHAQTLHQPGALLGTNMAAATKRGRLP